jgi:sulfide:quinone oxidoreductase
MTTSTTSEHDVLVLGGGTGGLTVAARLLTEANPPGVTILEPSEQHYYQPLWTLVGGGVFPKEASVRPQADYTPRGAQWIKDAAVEIDPETRTVTTRGGQKLRYRDLVVAPGIQLDWHKVEGLADAVGKDGITSNYRYDTVEYTWKLLREVSSGNALFTFPSTPVKCAGAPQKIMYLADDQFRRRGVRDAVKVRWMSASAGIFGVKKYAAALNRVVARKGIETSYRQDLVAVRPKSKEAVFRNLDDGKETVVTYAMLHAVPPQSAPDFIKQGPLASAAGWVDVHKHTLQHVKYPDVWGLGDASSLPTSRTGAAIRKEAPVLVQNLLARRRGEALTGHYDGYASCPLVTGYGKLILAEFDYDGNPMESFPFDQAEERWSLWAMKTYALPELYWNGMLKGRA